MPRVPQIALALAVAAGSAWAGKRDWTGSAACGKCHPAELAAWQTTAHAQTRTRFPGKPEARCLGCHGTGDAPAGPVIAVEVGCEACHGAGAAYAFDDVMRDRPVAIAMGMVDLATPKARSALCATCHQRATKDTSFDDSAPVHPPKASP